MGTLSKESSLKRVTHTSSVGGVYIQWGGTYIQWEWRMHLMGVAHTSNGVVAYIQWGWRTHPMGVSYTSYGGGAYIQWGRRIHPMGMAYTSNGGGVYIQCGRCISTVDLYFQCAKCHSMEICDQKCLLGATSINFNNACFYTCVPNKNKVLDAQISKQCPDFC